MILSPLDQAIAIQQGSYNVLASADEIDCTTVCSSDRLPCSE
ncbi:MULTISPECIES: hypothetical protein [unclassified Roseofilum]|nr:MULTISPECIES: hypothetical protein [unclassified Roseofilum]